MARTSSMWPKMIKNGLPSQRDSTLSNSRTPRKVHRFGYTKHSTWWVYEELSWSSGALSAKITSVITTTTDNTVWLPITNFFSRHLLSNSLSIIRLTISSLRNSNTLPPATNSAMIRLPNISLDSACKEESSQCHKEHSMLTEMNTNFSLLTNSQSKPPPSR